MTSTDELERLMREATKHFKLPFVADLATMKIFDAEYRMVADIRGWGYLTGKGDGALGLSEDEGITAQRELITGIVAAVNALPELVARVRRLEEALKPFAAVAGRLSPDISGDRYAWPVGGVSAGDLRRARAALNQEQTHESD